jgi:hypothetical protein
MNGFADGKNQVKLRVLGVNNMESMDAWSRAKSPSQAISIHPTPMPWYWQTASIMVTLPKILATSL